MRTSPQQSWRLIVPAAVAWLAVLVPMAAQAQYSAPELNSSAVGERYHVEVSGTLWNPTVSGRISSEQFGIIGSSIDFVDDLGFQKTRFKDFRLVLRPSKKSKFRIQYTPMTFVAETSLKRDSVFNGQKFPFALPVQSEFDWKVWRLGYEYDVFYRSRGFIGFFLEARYTEMTAQLKSPLVTEFRTDKAPLPAIGIVGRGYVLPELAINFEMSTFRVPANTLPNIEANYYDWNIDGTLNFTNNVGVKVGWRRVTNFLTVKHDTGDTKFQGLWFGAALRY